MENLFRLMLLRPAVSQDPEQPSIELDQESAYQDALRAAVAAGGGRKGVEAGSAEFAASADFVQGLGDTPLGQRQKLLDDRRKRVDQVPAEHEALRGAATYTRVLRAQHLKGQLAREGEEGGEPDERAGALQISTPYAELAQTLVAAPDVVLSARAGFTPVALAEPGFVLKPTAADRLSQSTQTVLKQRGIDLGTRADLAMFAANQQIPRYADLPEFARLVEGAMRPVVTAPKPVQSKREDMEERYRRLESELANYRYP